jgi:hypothetical protein
MDPHTPSKTETAHLRATTGRSMRWLLMARIGITALWDLALFRWAIDLVAPFFVMIFLLSHSVRDALGDWFSGDRPDDVPDPIWVLGVTGVSLFATVVALIWIFSTSNWVPEGVIPSVLVRAASFAEDHGWGRRAVLPGGPRERSTAVAAPPVTNQAATPQVGEGHNPGLVPSPSERPSSSAAGTTGRASTTTARQEPAPTGTSVRPALIKTSVMLASSASVAPVGSEVQLTATVTGTALDQPSGGSVIFRSGEAVIGSARLDEKGRAVVKLQTLAPGTVIVTAAFPGGRGFSASRSRAVTLTVTR